MHEVRGASLAEDIAAAVSTRRRGPRHFVALAVVFAVVYAGDQVTKALAVRGLADGRERAFLGHLLQLHLTRNPGAAFSTGTTYTWLLSCLAILAVLVVLWLSRRVASRWWTVAFALLLAGIGGNLTDRLLRPPAPMRGHVVDFLQLPHWPIFNLADVSINVAAAMILVQVFRGVRLDGSRVETES